MHFDNITALCVGITTAFFGFYALQIFRMPQRTRLQSVIGYIFLFRALLTLKGIIATYPDLRSPEIVNILIITDGFKGVTLVAFLFELVKPGWANMRNILLNCILFLAMLVAYLIWPTTIMMYIYAIFVVVYGVTICIHIWRKARRYIQYIRNNYSNIDNIDISWLDFVMIISIAGQLIWLAAIFVSNIHIDFFYYITLIVMWQIVLDHCLHQKPVKIEELPAFTPQLPPQKDYAFAGKLEQMVEEQQLYLNKDLTLADIARSVKTNRTYLSDYFTRVKHLTFYDYVNQLRIEQMAIPMIQQHPEYTFDYIATESGFNSISTFRRAFAKITGKSPSQYRNELETL